MIGQIAFSIGKNGRWVTSSDTLTGVNVAYIYIASDTEFTTLEDSNGNDCTDTWANGGQNLTGTINAGVTIAPRTGFYYKNIDLASGTVYAVVAED